MDRSPHYQLRSQLATPSRPDGMHSRFTSPHSLPPQGKSAYPNTVDQDQTPRSQAHGRIRSEGPKEPYKEHSLYTDQKELAECVWESPTLPYLQPPSTRSPSIQSPTPSTTSYSSECAPRQTHLSRLGPKLRLGGRPPWESPLPADDPVDFRAPTATPPIEPQARSFDQPRPSTSTDIVSSLPSLSSVHLAPFQHGTVKSSGGGNQVLKSLGGMFLRKVRSQAELGGEEKNVGTPGSLGLASFGQSGRGEGLNVGGNYPPSSSYSNASSEETSQGSVSPITPVDGL